MRQAILDGGMVPLIIAPTGGPPDGESRNGVRGVLDALTGGGEPLVAQRTFATARSVEFDALLVAGAPAPGADAYGARDAKAGDLGGAIDPRVLLMLAEAYRHGKPIGGWDGAMEALALAAIPTGAPGVLLGDRGDEVLTEIVRLLGRHRVWERFPAAAALS